VCVLRKTLFIIVFLVGLMCGAFALLPMADIMDLTLDETESQPLESSSLLGRAVQVSAPAIRLAPEWSLSMRVLPSVGSCRSDSRSGTVPVHPKSDFVILLDHSLRR